MSQKLRVINLTSITSILAVFAKLLCMFFGIIMHFHTVFTKHTEKFVILPIYLSIFSHFICPSLFSRSIVSLICATFSKLLCLFFDYRSHSSFSSRKNKTKVFVKTSHQSLEYLSLYLFHIYPMLSATFVILLCLSLGWPLNLPTVFSRKHPNFPNFPFISLSSTTLFIPRLPVTAIHHLSRLKGIVPPSVLTFIEKQECLLINWQITSVIYKSKSRLQNWIFCSTLKCNLKIRIQMKYVLVLKNIADLQKRLLFVFEG